MYGNFYYRYRKTKITKGTNEVGTKWGIIKTGIMKREGYGSDTGDETGMNKMEIKRGKRQEYKEGREKKWGRKKLVK
jgi:hypothetical protein